MRTERLKSKVCRGCGELKPFTAYCPHAQMADGRLNYCMDCVKARVRRHREKNIDRVRDYDRRRAKKPERIGQIVERARRFRDQHPEKYRAHYIVSNAIRDGRLERRPCDVCGRPDSHGHHEDYSNPLDVIWLCPVCHSALHHQNICLIPPISIDASEGLRG